MAQNLNVGLLWAIRFGMCGVHRDFGPKPPFVKELSEAGALQGGNIAYVGVATSHAHVKPRFAGGQVLTDKANMFLAACSHNIHGTQTCTH